MITKLLSTGLVENWFGSIVHLVSMMPFIIVGIWDTFLALVYNFQAVALDHLVNFTFTHELDIKL